MTDFKIGDRVAVYSIKTLIAGKVVQRRVIGEVNQVKPDGIIIVDTDELSGMYVHKNQCRKLVKKERRRIWVSPVEPNHSCVPIEGWTEFVEVRKKK